MKIEKNYNTDSGENEDGDLKHMTVTWTDKAETKTVCQS